MATFDVAGNPWLALALIVAVLVLMLLGCALMAWVEDDLREQR